MIEEAPSISIGDYKDTFKYPANEDSLAKAITGAKFLTTNNEEENRLLETIQNPRSPETDKLWSLEDAKNQERFIYASLITQIATAKDYSDLTNGQFFKKLIINPIENWNTIPESSDIQEVHKERRNIEESVTGLLWTLYKGEIKGYDNETAFAKSLFSQRNYVIRPYSYNESKLAEVKAQLNQKQ